MLANLPSCLDDDLNNMIKSRSCIAHIVRMEEDSSAFIILTDNPTKTRIVGRLRRRWQDGVTKDLKEIGVSTRNWIDSAHDCDYWSCLVTAIHNSFS